MQSIYTAIQEQGITLTDDGRIFAANTPRTLFYGLAPEEIEQAVDMRIVSQDMIDVLLEQLDSVNYAALVNGCNDLEPSDEDMKALAIILAEHALIVDTLGSFYDRHSHSTDALDMTSAYGGRLDR